jgi:hypothetical protein
MLIVFKDSPSAPTIQNWYQFWHILSLDLRSLLFGPGVWWKRRGHV